jgi:hypothetical protein
VSVMAVSSDTVTRSTSVGLSVESSMMGTIWKTKPSILRCGSDTYRSSLVGDK